MRNELGKECRRIFRRMMLAEFPEYHEDKGQVVPQGRYVWTCEHPSGIWLRILLIVNTKFDKFTTEAGWDADGKLPAFRLVREDIDTIFQSPVLFRSSSLWSRKDDWWPLVLRPEEHERVILYKDDPIEQCLPLVASAVADAAEKIKDYVLPAFEKIVEIHGKKPARETER